MKIEDLDLSVRAYNCLKRVGIDTVEQIRERDAEEMLRIRNLGKKCFDEIMEKINCIRDTEYSDLLRKLREDWTGSREEAARAIEDLQRRLKDTEKAAACKWISAVEHLPERNTSVLVYIPSEAQDDKVQTAYVDYLMRWTGAYGRFPKGSITHWMPLPAAPEVGE